MEPSARRVRGRCCGVSDDAEILQTIGPASRRSDVDIEGNDPRGLAGCKSNECIGITTPPFQYLSLIRDGIAIAMVGERLLCRAHWKHRPTATSKGKSSRKMGFPVH